MEHMAQIVDWMDKILTNANDDALKASIKQDVEAMMGDYPLFAW